MVLFLSAMKLLRILLEAALRSLLVATSLARSIISGSLFVSRSSAMVATFVPVSGSFTRIAVVSVTYGGVPPPLQVDTLLPAVC